MNRSALLYAVLCALGFACATAPPTQQLADVQAAVRSADELGAQANPQAQLHYSLAQDQFGRAKALLKQNNNEEATRLLERAHADAELAVALMYEVEAKHDADLAKSDFQAQRITNSATGETP